MKPDLDTTEHTSSECSPSERSLWLAVIANAIEDAKGFVRGSDRLEVKARESDSARRWLTEPNRDFNTVCYLAGLDPEGVRARARRVLLEDAA